MNKNLFRKDLYFRLNVVPITVPPLRERKEEIPALAAQFVRQFNQKYELNKSLDPKVIDKLIAYNWPGNIRELENVIERTLVTHSGDIIDDVALPDDSRAYGKSSQSSQSTQPLKEAVEALERQMISGALNTYGSTRKAARALGVSQPTIVRKAARYGLQSDTQTDA